MLLVLIGEQIFESQHSTLLYFLILIQLKISNWETETGDVCGSGIKQKDEVAAESLENWANTSLKLC